MLSTTSALVVGDELEQGRDPVCVYCAQPHSSVHCSVVTNVEKRKEILKKVGRCFTCIMKNRISKNCHSKARCNNSHGRHHSNICHLKEKSRQENSKPPRQENSKPPEKENSEPNNRKNEGKEETVDLTMMCVSTKNAVLLQKAKAATYKPDLPHRRRYARIILDGGSQRSYITDQIRNEMKLTASHSESLTLKPFGSSTGTSQVCNVVDLCLGVYGDRGATYHPLVYL